MSATHIGRSGVAVRNIQRSDSVRIQELTQFGVATIHEAQGRRGLLDASVRPIQTGKCVAGSALTILAPPGDNWMFHVAVELSQPGDLLLVATTSPCGDGYFGDLLATSFMAHGVQAIVTEGGIRDTATLREMQFAAWTRSIHAQGTVKNTLGSVNVPVNCAGAMVSPGDIVVADDDGVVIIPRLSLTSVLEASRRRADLEESKRSRMAQGELGLDIYQMRLELAAKGFRYVETPDDLERD